MHALIPRAACLICGEPVNRPHGKYCSYKCAGEAKRTYRTCPVCGERFAVSPSATVQTCRKKECSAAHRRQLHDQGKYDRATQLAREGLAKSPLTARGSIEHWAAQSWVIRSPDGVFYECRNLMGWLCDHADMLDGTPKQAFDGIAKIKYSRQGKRKNPSYSWKGWTLITWGD